MSQPSQFAIRWLLGLKIFGGVAEGPLKDDADL